MENILQLKRAVLEYIYHNGTFDDIKAKCLSLQTVEKQEKAFYFSLSITPSELVEENSGLGNLLLNHCTVATRIFQEVIYMLIKTLNLLPTCTYMSQVIITFKISSLPSLPHYMISSALELTWYAQSQRFLQYKGVITGMSILHKYTKSARYFCPDLECEGSQGNRFIRLHIPGAREDQTIRKGFTCTYCGQPLQEDLTCRILENKLIVELVDEEAFSTPNKTRYQAVCAYLRGDLLTKQEIGETVNIIGLPVYDPLQNILALEVNNFAEADKPSTAYLLNHQDRSKWELLPAAIRQLFLDRNYSLWSFGLSLAYAFAGHIAPPGTYLHFKLGLLLSIVESFDCQRGLGVLAVANDLIVVDRLLRFAATFCNKYVSHNVHDHLAACVVRDRHSTGVPFIEGGSLLLANGGVCLLSDMGSYKTSVRTELRRVLESSAAYVEIPPSVGSDGGVQQQFLPLRCTVWGSLCPSQTNKNRNSVDDLPFYQINLDDAANTLVSVFGMVYFTEIKTGTYAEFTSLHQTLLAAMGHDPVLLISDADFKEMFNQIKKIAAELSMEAECLIKGYYIASRRVRASLGNATVPQSAVSTITNLALSHAKLHLRTRATEDDALMAVFLYEESSIYRYGNSVLNLQPMPHIPDNNTEAYIGPEWDLKLQKFHQDLKHFINLHALEDSFCEE